MDLRLMLFGAVVAASAVVQAAELRIGMIGLDTSHATAFTQILNDPTRKDHVPGGRVVAAFKASSPDLESSRSRVDEYTQELTGKWGVKLHDTIDAMCREVDAVMIESVDGRPHREQARAVIEAGKPLYIDKPMAASLRDVVAIFAMAKARGVPVFSSSSLRFAKGTLAVRGGSIGRVLEAETFSPCHRDPTHPDLYWYGIHGVESLFTVMGTGCESVRRGLTADGKIQVVGTWAGGRRGTYREGEGYGGRARGERGEAEVGAFDGYAPLVREIVAFFQTGKVPVTPEETIELFAFMSAADVSLRRGGAEVRLAEMLDEARAAAFRPNEDESQVPAYTLPDPLRMEDGRRVETARQWRRERRPEILELFREQVYGHRPGTPDGMRFVLRSEDREALGGLATRREVRVHLGPGDEAPWMDVLLYVPSQRRGKVPAFLGMNFEGNHAVTREAGVTVTERWVANNPREGREGNRATEASRGSESSRWPIERILQRGYALATVYYGDLEPDHREGWRSGVRAWFPARGNPARIQGGQTPGMADWGAIAAWGWGLSRAMDYLERDPAIDARRVAVMGHSRLGKTALWAGAEDERFAMVISNNSGEGGAALARRRFGETTERINSAFPHWFCGNFKQYNNREDAIPVDQHELIALIAPRPVYVASAEKDLWADPRGEFLAAKGAEPVYRLLGREGLGVAEMPGLNQPVGDTIGYHNRTGVHDVTDYDWDRYLDFADRHFRRSRR